MLSEFYRRRLRLFWSHKMGRFSLIILLAILTFSLPAEWVANDKPLVVVMNGEVFFPIFVSYTEQDFGGDYALKMGYDAYFFQDILEASGGFALWPLIPFSYQTIDTMLSVPAPSPPSSTHWLGTDDHGRDVLARLLYGLRISFLFGLTLAVLSSFVGILAGAMQGYIGGMLDLFMQRFLEIWNSMPQLFVVIIIASIFYTNFFFLLLLTFLFSWTALVGMVRAECLRVRNFTYILAARALGVGRWKMLVRHVLPNATVTALTFFPFLLSGAVVTLTSLDFLGFGMPPGSPSMGELLLQGKNNLHAPWLGIVAFVSMALFLALLIFIGEGVREALDPKKQR